MKGRGGEGRGGNIFNDLCLVQFLGAEVRGERMGAKSLIHSFFAFPQIGGIWRGGEGSYLNNY
jgi:hypothetical protein